MTAVLPSPAVIVANPVSAPPSAVAIDDRNARIALRIAAAHALVAVVLSVTASASSDRSVDVLMDMPPSPLLIGIGAAAVPSRRHCRLGQPLGSFREGLGERALGQ